MAATQDRILVPAESKVWKYLGFEADSNKQIINKKSVYCMLCKLSMLIPYSSNTLNLSYRLGKHHPIEYSEIYELSKASNKQDKGRPLHQETLCESFSKAMPYAKDSKKNLENEANCTLLVTADPNINLPHIEHIFRQRQF